MNQIARCDWLPKRARWSHLARSVLHAASRKKNSPESHIINPLLTKFVWSRCLDIGLVFLRVYKHAKKKNWANIQPSWPHTWSITHTYSSSALGCGEMVEGKEANSAMLVIISSSNKHEWNNCFIENAPNYRKLKKNWKKNAPKTHVFAYHTFVS